MSERVAFHFIIADEDMLIKTLTLTALQIDKIVEEADEARYLASVARGGAGDVPGGA